MSKRSNWSIPYVIFLVFFVVLPLVLVLVYAFQDGQLVQSQYSFFTKDADTDTDLNGNPSVFATGMSQTCLLHREDSDGVPHWEEPSPTLLPK